MGKRWWLMLAIFIVAVVAVGLTPMRQIAAQKLQVDDVRAELAALEEENRVLADRAAELQSDAGVERIAREHFGLVRPGDRIYAVDTEGLSPAERSDPELIVPPAEPNIFTNVIDFFTGQDVVEGR
ncbi:MAG: septum formation initiator family protein [Acidimicrobiia bacterium]|nr:septum formation initiator family protein [Acidimicrobiia bacterium]MBT8250221.1 septum formation initiator family protein [Acidimicrobiia bacterium]NNC43105.1 septum formation initiator family protein [Acidimicrobiia bacterium]NND14435.1 septum formation initiator family protein [Acidimicrobiia bacterium]NNL28384.1 septum formation initiator family protein [Acidimicrobiia bacterium]